MGILQSFWKVVKKYGIRKTFRAIVLLAWFTFPFLIWVMIYDWLGNSFVLLEWGFVGALIILIFLLIVTFFNVKTILLRDKLSKHVEHARKLFANPTDADSEKTFHDECGKFILPYLHFRGIYNVGFTTYMKNSKPSEKIALRIAFVLLFIVSSYLAFVFCINNQPFFESVSELLSPSLTYFAPLSSIFLILYQNIFLVTIITFFFSTYFSTQIYRGISRFPEGLVDVICDYFSIFTRITLLGSIVLSSPWSIREHIRGINYSPFTFQPITTIDIIQKSVENIEQTQCQVTVWQYEVEK